MAATSFFGGAFFGGEFFYTPPVGAADHRGWGERKKKRGKVIRWSDYADAEERRLALAAELAAASVPLADIRAADGSIENDAITEEEDALITALVMSKLLH